MNTLFLVVLLEYIGVPKDAAEIIALITVYADPKTAAARTWNRSQPHFEPHAHGR